MYEPKKIGKVFTSKSFRTGPSSYGKRIYRAAVSQRLTNTGLHYSDLDKNRSMIMSAISAKQYVSYILSGHAETPTRVRGDVCCRLHSNRAAVHDSLRTRRRQYHPSSHPPRPYRESSYLYGEARR